jgi:hypothetical protein
VDVASNIQLAVVERVLAYGGLTWLVVAMMVGLWAAEMKKRRFWVWVGLSLAIGPIAWYLLLFRLGVAVPDEVRVSCPSCGKDTRGDQKLCIHCRRLVKPEQRDRATEFGRQAATWVFTARRLAGGARRAAEKAAAARKEDAG